MRLNSFASTAALALAVAGLAGFSGVAQAESSVGTAAPVSARLDFRVVIPGVVFLQVGSGAFRENVGTVDRIVFEPTDEQVTNGGVVSATTASGNLTNGAVTVRVFGNVGALALSSTASTLASGANTIPWNQINVAVTGAVPHEPFGADGAMTVNLATTGAGASPLVNREGTWTYSYANTDTFRPGTYEGRVTYSVASP